MLRPSRMVELIRILEPTQLLSDKSMHHCFLILIDMHTGTVAHCTSTPDKIRFSQNEPRSRH